MEGFFDKVDGNKFPVYLGRGDRCRWMAYKGDFDRAMTDPKAVLRNNSYPDDLSKVSGFLCPLEFIEE